MKKVKEIINVISYPLLIVLLMWIVFLAELKYGYNFNKYGIYPRRIESLIGVIASPFLHSDVKHLVNNTTSFFVLMSLLRLFYKESFLKVFLLGWLISGLITWCIAREAYHIGMSGVIYVLASFIFTKSFFSKNYHLIALSLVIVFLYGSMIWYVFPIDRTISWEGHLAGLIAGVALSFFFKNEVKEEESKPLNPQQELFLAHFNDEGKFVANLPFLDQEGELIVVYEFKPSSEEE